MSSLRASQARTENAAKREVLFVCLATGLGGSTRSLVTVLEHLGPGVTRVLAGPSAGKFVSLLKERNAVDDLVPLRKVRSGPVRLSRLQASAQIARWTWRHRRSLTAIHVNGPEELNIAAPSAILTRVPVILWSHARDVSPSMSRLAPVLRRLLPGGRFRAAAVSPAARRVLAESGLVEPGRVRIIPDPIDPGDVLATGERESRPVTIGYLGSDARYKGFQLVPDVVERLRDVPVRWALFTESRSADNAPAWDRVRALPKDVVMVSGKLADVREAYGQCDVVFCPSLEESFGRVVAEAMLNGIPVVASDLEPVRDLLVDEEAVLLFPPGNAAAAAQAIRRLVSDPDLMARLGEQGRVRVGAFHPRAVVDALAELYGVQMA